MSKTHAINQINQSIVPYAVLDSSNGEQEQLVDDIVYGGRLSRGEIENTVGP